MEEPPLKHSEAEPSGIIPRRRGLRDVAILAALALLALLAFWDVVVGDRVFFFRDFGLYFYPQRHYVAGSIRSGRIPFWNSYEGCGQCVLGTLQSAVFYPLALIYYILPMPKGLMVFVVMHLFISGAGAYRMMRAWGARRSAAIFTGTAWAFCPAFVSTLDYVSFMSSLSWLPWCLAFARRVTAGATPGGFVWLAISFAMAILAGHPEPVIFIALLLTVYAAWTFVSNLRKASLAHAVRTTAPIAAAVIVGVLISGVEVVPFLHALGCSFRYEGLSIEDSAKWSASPNDALLLFLPRFMLFAERGGIYWHGQHWLKTVYLGALVPFLAAWTLLAVRRRRNWFFAAVAVLFVLMAVGSNSPLWFFARKYVAGFALIRYPVKFYLPVAFALTALAGLAFDDLLVCARKREALRPALLVALAAAAAVAFAACLWFVEKYPESILPSITPRNWFLSKDVGARRLEDCCEATQWSFGRSAACLAAGAAALAVAALFSRLRTRRPYGAVPLVAVLFLDVALFGAHLNPLAGPEIYTDNPGHLAMVPHGQTEQRLFMTPALNFKLLMGHLEEVHSLKGLMESMSLVSGIRFQNTGEFLEWIRPMNPPQFPSDAEFDKWLRDTVGSQFQTCLEYQFYKETFYPDLNTLYGVPTVDGFESIPVKWHESILKEMHSGKLPERRDRVLARMWGAGIVADIKPEAPGFVYLPMEPPGARAFLTDSIVSAQTDREAFELVTHSDIDTARQVVLIEPDAEVARGFLSGSRSPEPAAAAAGAVRLLRDDGNNCSFEVHAVRHALLFVADNYFPNFAARVDGQRVPLWRANYAYRAVPVEPGRHTVEFYWRPYDFYLGLAVTSVGILVLIAAPMFPIFRRK